MPVMQAANNAIPIERARRAGRCSPGVQRKVARFSVMTRLQSGVARRGSAKARVDGAPRLALKSVNWHNLLAGGVNLYTTSWSSVKRADGKATYPRPAGIAEGATVPSVTLTPAWLAGRTVKEFRISREGVRALVISEQNGKTRVQVTGIIRGGDGTPRERTPPITLATGSEPDQGAWVSDTTIAVMKGSAASNVTPELLSLASGQPQQLAQANGLVLRWLAERKLSDVEPG